MCDRQDEAVLFNKHKKAVQIQKTCKRCEEKGIVVLRVNDVYCRSCFLAYFIHKFRACLGKAKVMKHGDKVLVAFSGGQSSLAMLHLIKQALEEENRKKLEYHPVILYIDEGGILNQTHEERNNICHEVIDSVAWTGFPTYVTSLEMFQEVDSSDETKHCVLVTQANEKTEIPINSVLEKKLHDLFTSISSLSAKEDILERLRNRLISKVAEKLNCNKIFLGDSASLLCIRLLSNISQGRGAHLTTDTGFSHHVGNNTQILVLRPMRELLLKEVALYNNLNKLSSINIPTLGTKTDPRSSISHLMEEFINGLQQEFPATVSTVFRTGDKLDSHNMPLSQVHCILCENYLDTDVAPDSALNSTELSRMEVKMNSLKEDRISCDESRNPVHSNNKADVNTENCNKNLCMCSNGEIGLENPTKNMRISKDDLSSHLCYGCRLIIQDCNDISALPENILSEAKRRIRRNRMKEEISEFLL